MSDLLGSPENLAKDTLFKDLVHKHQSRLYRFVVKHVGYGSDAEDLTQQAFVEAAASFESFRGTSSLSTWLYGIALNLVRNYLSRTPRRRYNFVDESALDEVQSNQPDPSEQLAQSQLVRALLKEAGELPEEMQEVLLLVALDEFSYEEAAVLLSVPVGTVRSRLSRARTKLRQKLGAAQFDL